MTAANLQVIPQSNLVTFSQEQIELVKRTVGADATNDELQMFLYLSQQYGLDPFKREIWFWKAGGRPVIMTSRDGYLKVSQGNPNYDGVLAGVVKEGDNFEFDAVNSTVKHSFGTKRGKIAGAWAIAYHKQYRPVCCFVDFDEYNQPSKDVWKKYPSAMIQKVAEAFVLKRQFGISGMVTQEEIGGPDAIDVSFTSNGKQTGIDGNKPLILGETRGLSETDVKLLLYSQFRAVDTEGLSQEQLTKFCSTLRSITDDDLAAVIVKLREAKAAADAKKNGHQEPPKEDPETSKFIDEVDAGMSAEEMSTTKQQQKIHILANEKGLQDCFKPWMNERYKTESTKQLTKKQASECIEYLDKTPQDKLNEEAAWLKVTSGDGSAA